VLTFDCPAEIPVTVTVIVLPMSAAATTYVAEVAPPMFAPLLFHWYV